MTTTTMRLELHENTKLRYKVNELCYANSTMPKPCGREHTTLTETATLVVRELYKIPGIKMIAPGEINTASRRKGGKRFVTVVELAGGCELIITGQGVQKVAVHGVFAAIVIAHLQQTKALREFSFSQRSRKPGV